VLYIIGAILDSVVGRPNTEYCTGLSHVPLPAPRDLWDWESRKAWAYRYKTYIESGKAEMVLTIANLKNSSNGSTNQRMLSALAKWTEGVDAFGTMVSLAALMD
jgi:hypothetical protein